MSDITAIAVLYCNVEVADCTFVRIGQCHTDGLGVVGRTSHGQLSGRMLLTGVCLTVTCRAGPQITFVIITACIILTVLIFHLQTLIITVFQFKFIIIVLIRIQWRSHFIGHPVESFLCGASAATRASGLPGASILGTGLLRAGFSRAGILRAGFSRASFSRAGILRFRILFDQHLFLI